ncbi:MAG TPA: hypothetical protein VNW97_15220 [Candidatus Saccharimonadales bacterium]|jgi:hypothetical protein|nr:hypothetical protein [Candidatus Saccharimonadales bacterium]
MTDHDCQKHLREYTATHNKPYHFVDSGLPNVYLIGVKYRVCRKCGAQAADIPAPTKLMNLIAECIVMRPGILCGPEIRFLRKRLGKRAVDFAGLINNTPEHFSKLETGSLPLQAATDKLIRLTYSMFSDDKDLLPRISAKVEEWFKAIHAKKVYSIQIRSERCGWTRVVA